MVDQDGHECPEFNRDDWFDRLEKKLDVAGRGYVRRDHAPSADEAEIEAIASWPALRQYRVTFAMAAVGIVRDALRELPGYRGSEKVVPFEELCEALEDLSRGLHPPLLRPVKAGPKGVKMSNSWRRLKNKAITYVDIFVEAGLRPAKAYQEVAKLIADAGFPAYQIQRNGASGAAGFKASTLKDWHSAADLTATKEKDPYAPQARDRRQRQIVNELVHDEFSPADARRHVKADLSSPSMTALLGTIKAIQQAKAQKS